jgi:hypothetical protein
MAEQMGSPIQITNASRKYSSVLASPERFPIECGGPSKQELIEEIARKYGVD